MAAIINVVNLPWHYAYLRFRHSLCKETGGFQTICSIPGNFQPGDTGLECRCIEGDAAAHPVAAAASAAYTVLLHELPTKKAMLDSQPAKAVDTILDLNAKQKSIALGLQCGNAIIDLRKDDGTSQYPVGAVAPSTVPGVYQTVSPLNFVVAPFWKTLKPIGLLQPQQFRTAPYPALNSTAYKKDFEEVKTFGEKNSSLRTAEQTFYPLLDRVQQKNFKSLFCAADENADSRVMAGLHFRLPYKAGQTMGSKIGRWITENTLMKAE